MKKGTLSTVVLVLVFLIGLSLLLYPTVSDLWNSHNQSRVIYQYEKQVVSLDHSVYDQLLSDARDYNLTLLGRDRGRFLMTDEEREGYNALLNISDSGVMGYVEIPAIGVTLPIYHGTGESALQVAAGHVEGSSLPVGGPGTHAVLSGHRGLPSAKLFTDIDKLKEGDIFLLRVLDEVLTYQVDQTLVVLPEEMDALAIDPEGDYCTLVTCTPYGINTHRLLVRGHRIENLPEPETEPAPAPTHDAGESGPRDAIQWLPVLAAAVLVVLLIVLLMVTRRRPKARAGGKYLRSARSGGARESDGPAEDEG